MPFLQRSGGENGSSSSSPVGVLGEAFMKGNGLLGQGNGLLGLGQGEKDEKKVNKVEVAKMAYNAYGAKKTLKATATQCKKGINKFTEEQKTAYKAKQLEIMKKNAENKKKEIEKRNKELEKQQENIIAEIGRIKKLKQNINEGYSKLNNLSRIEEELYNSETEIAKQIEDLEKQLGKMRLGLFGMLLGRAERARIELQIKLLVQKAGKIYKQRCEVNQEKRNLGEDLKAYGQSVKEKENMLAIMTDDFRRNVENANNQTREDINPTLLEKARSVRTQLGSKKFKNEIENLAEGLRENINEGKEKFFKYVSKGLEATTKIFK
jgi:chromosome segregation ATPase